MQSSTEILKAITSSGWKPIPFQQYVIKVNSTCNLACDYCYIYQMADQTWSEKPATISRETVELSCFRIGEHVSKHQLKTIEVVIHGGEPLLAGTSLITSLAETLRNSLPESTALSLVMQTNGIMLNERTLDVLQASSIGVGVSLDGDQAANDRHRRFASGKSSYGRVEKSIALLNSPAYRGMYTGLLCTVDVDNDPVETYESLIRFNPPTLDFLLPLGNWNSPPPKRDLGQSGTPYADWLIAIFDRWYSAPRQETKIRYFREIMRLILGHESRIETIGLSPVSAVVIETDGTFEQIDTLKSTFHGAARTGLNVVDNTFDEVMSHPDIVVRQVGKSALCETCLECPIVDICGGGYYAHRYSTEKGFMNPSVYCPDLLRLVEHIRATLSRDLSKWEATSA